MTNIESTEHLAQLVAEAIQDDVDTERVKEAVAEERYSFTCSDQNENQYVVMVIKTNV